MDLIEFVNELDDFVGKRLSVIKSKAATAKLAEKKQLEEFISAYEDFAAGFMEYLTVVNDNKNPLKLVYEDVIFFDLYGHMSLEMFKLLSSRQENKKAWKTIEAKKAEEQFKEQAEKELRSCIVYMLLSKVSGIELSDLSKPVIVEKEEGGGGISLEPLRLQEPYTNFIDLLFERYGVKKVLSFVSDTYGSESKTAECFLSEAKKKEEAEKAEELIKNILEGEYAEVEKLLQNVNYLNVVNVGVGGDEYTPLYYAILIRNERMVNLLLRRGAYLLQTSQVSSTTEHDAPKDEKEYTREVAKEQSEILYSMLIAKDELASRFSTYYNMLKNFFELLNRHKKLKEPTTEERQNKPPLNPEGSKESLEAWQEKMSHLSPEEFGKLTAKWKKKLLSEKEFEEITVEWQRRLEQHRHPLSLARFMQEFLVKPQTQKPVAIPTAKSAAAPAAATKIAAVPKPK